MVVGYISPEIIENYGINFEKSWTSIKSSLDVFYNSFCLEMDHLFMNVLNEKPNIVIDNFIHDDAIIIDRWMDQKDQTIVINSDYFEETLGLNCDKCLNRWIKTREFNLGHEIAHLYRFERNPDLRGKLNSFFNNYSKTSWIIEETIAELSAMTYFHKNDKLEEVLDYVLGVSFDYNPNSDFNFGRMAYDMVTKNSDNLDSFLYHFLRCDEEEAIKVISNYESSHRNLHYVSRDRYFQNCVHKGDSFINYEKQLLLF